jgi:hypothetical protein
MLKCALALLVVAAAIDATKADGHAGVKTTCDEKCEADFQASGGRNRRVGHSVIKTTCLASCQTDFDIEDAKQKCDGVCKAAFDEAEAGKRSRRAAHAAAQTLCEAKCTAAQTTSLGVQAGAVCDAGCQSVFDAYVPAQTAAEFCADYTTKCDDDATAPAFEGADADAKTATCEAWYGGADAGTLGDPIDTTAAGATQACYQYHLSVAVDTGSKATHCQHARGDSVCAAGRNRRDGHAAARTVCKTLCATPLSAAETAFAEYTEMVATFVNDPEGLQKFVKAEADKCTCANHVGEVATVCGVACTTSAALENSSGSFASSAAAVVIAGLAAALY